MLTVAIVTAALMFAGPVRVFPDSAARTVLGLVALVTARPPSVVALWPTPSVAALSELPRTSASSLPLARRPEMPVGTAVHVRSRPPPVGRLVVTAAGGVGTGVTPGMSLLLG